MKPLRFFKTKVVSGYILIVAIFFVSIYYVLQEVQRITSLDSDQAELQNKRSFINQTIFHLYQAEGYGQLAVVDPQNYTGRYRRALGTVKKDLDSLRSAARQSGELSQTARLDSILDYIRIKEQSLVNLNRTNYRGSLDELYNKTIEQIIARKDTLPAEAPPPGNLIIREDTVKMAGAKKSFFRRLANAFFPDKKDSVVLVASKIVVDSLPPAPVSVADTITGILRDLQGDVHTERQKLVDQTRAEIRNISYSNYLISRKINQLLLEFEQQESRRILFKIELQNQIIRHSIYILGIIASLAIVLTMLFVTIIWRDINRNNRYKRELEEANKYNKDLLEAREKLMMAITHDIKAPLSSIMGYLDLLEGLSAGKRSRLYIRYMKGSSEHLLELVNTLLDFYRLETNKMDVHSVTFNPARLFETIYNEFLPTADKKGIAFTYRVTPAADIFVTGDPFHIRQIADNLVSNALKFTDRGTVKLEAGLNDGILYFSVTDTGKGMTEEEKNKIFGEFVRLKSAQGVAGSGLGLSIVEGLVKLLGGHISVHSKPGAGSTFKVQLPVSPARESIAETTGPAAGQPYVERNNLHCLVIDDDKFQLELVRNMCTQLGIASDICQYPEKVPRLLAACPYDIIFTDLQMPALTGFEVLELIRKTPGCTRVPVVAVSARADETRGEFTAVLHKPFKLQELADIINRVAPAAPGTQQMQNTDPDNDAYDFPDKSSCGNPPESPCETPGKASCEEPCEKPCEELCDMSCEEPCEKPCEELCDISCEEPCEKPCEELCDMSCEEPCEKPCEELCDMSCEEPCEKPCEELCDMSCEKLCEMSYEKPCKISCEESCETALHTKEKTSRGVMKDGSSEKTVNESVIFADNETGGRKAEESRQTSAEKQPLNFGALTAFAADDKNAAKQILASFSKEYRENAGRLIDAARKNDPETVRKTAHKMLPIFKLLGATQVAHALEKMESGRGEGSCRWHEEIENTAVKIRQITEQAEKEITLL